MNRTLLVFKITLAVLFIFGISIFIYTYLSKSVNTSVMFSPFNEFIRERSQSTTSVKSTKPGVIVVKDESGFRTYIHGIVVDIKDVGSKYDVILKSGEDINNVSLDKSKPIYIVRLADDIINQDQVPSIDPVLVKSRDDLKIKNGEYASIYLGEVYISIAAKDAK